MTKQGKQQSNHNNKTLRANQKDMSLCLKERRLLAVTWASKAFHALMVLRTKEL